jgi:outer membrane lipoprotein-sorting protein
VENKLKDLNEKMNSTLLKDLDFNENRMIHVLKSIKNEEQSPSGSLFSRTWKFALSSTLLASLLTGITLFTVDQLHPPDTSKTSIINKMTTKSLTQVYVPEKKEEYFGTMTKEEILTKMINTIDNFETAKGSFEESTQNNKMIVDYELNMKNPIGGYSKTVSKGETKPETEIVYYDNSTIWSISKETNSYRKIGYNPTATCCTLTIDTAFSEDVEGIDMTSYRDRPPIGLAQNSLFPYEIASNYTRDLERWEIEKQDEMLLGHNTIVLKGQLNSYASEKHSSQTFRFWVDKDTGILVQYETYNDQGEVVNYLHPKELLINVPVEINRLKPDTKNYKNQMVIDKEDPSISSGVSESDIPTDIKEKWKQAMEKPNDTTVLQSNGKWYIIPEKGYLVDKIETDGSQGTLLIVKASSQKEKHVFPVIIEGYNIAIINVKK